jgi:hypothetical protein
MTVDHRALAIGYFNASWTLIDLPTRTAEQNRDMLSLALASRQHWIEADGGPEQLATADWQVAHTAALSGFGELSVDFAQSAADLADGSDVPSWLKASTHEGLARAYAASGDRVGFDRESATTRALLKTVADPEDRKVVEDQLASITAPM